MADAEPSGAILAKNLHGPFALQLQSERQMTVQSIATGTAAWPAPSTSKAGSSNGGAFAKILEDTASTPAQPAISQPVVNSRKLTLPAWDAAQDPATNTLDGVKSTQAQKLDRLSGKEWMERVQAVKANTAKFAEELQHRLSAAGIDTSVPVMLDVKKSDGSIVVRGEHPQKEAIERLFAEDPALAERYNMIAKDNAFAATIPAHSRYVIDWNDADDDKERESVWRRQVAFEQSVKGVAGQLTLSGGSLTSTATQMAANFMGVSTNLLA